MDFVKNLSAAAVEKAESFIAFFVDSDFPADAAGMAAFSCNAGKKRIIGGRKDFHNVEGFLSERISMHSLYHKTDKWSVLRKKNVFRERKKG